MQVNITKRIDTPEGKRYCSVIVGPNGRIKPDWVLVNVRRIVLKMSSAYPWKDLYARAFQVLRC